MEIYTQSIQTKPIEFTEIESLKDKLVTTVTLVSSDEATIRMLKTGMEDIHLSKLEQLLKHPTIYTFPDSGIEAYYLVYGMFHDKIKIKYNKEELKFYLIDEAYDLRFPWI